MGFLTHNDIYMQFKVGYWKRRPSPKLVAEVRDIDSFHNNECQS